MNADFEILLLVAVAIVVGQVIAGLLWSNQSGPDATLARVEKKLDLLLKNLGVEYPQPQVAADIEALLLEGKIIEAIKRQRELNPGMGLKEAKAAIDEYRQAHGL